MAYISKITLPNSSTYDIKDTSAWNEIGTLYSMINEISGVGLVITKVDALPAASQETLGKIYLISDTTHNPSTYDIYDEYITIDNGEQATIRYTWEKIGNTDVSLDNYSAKGHKHSINKTTSNLNVLALTHKKISNTVKKEKLVVADVSVIDGVTEVEVAQVGTAVKYGTADVGNPVTVLTGLIGVQKVITAALGSASLTGTTTFNTDAIKASYSNETLVLNSASTGTVSISTSPSNSSISLSNQFSSTNITPAKASPSTQTINPAVSGGTIQNVSIKSVTLATGACSSSGDGSTVVIDKGTDDISVYGANASSSTTIYVYGKTSSGGLTVVTDVSTYTEPDA